MSQPSSALCVGIAASQGKMKDDQCAFYLGSVRRRAAEAMYTYVHYRSVKAYILQALRDPRLADVIAPVWKNVSDVLLCVCRMSPIPCGLVENLTIDHDYNLPVVWLKT